VNRDIGKNAERELVSLLRENGFKAVRIPTSNSSHNPLPDVFATKGNTLLAIECKSTWEDKVKVRSIQVEKLFGFLSMFTMEGIPLIAVKFKKLHQWRVVVLTKIEDILVSSDNSMPMDDFLLNKVNRREEVLI